MDQDDRQFQEVMSKISFISKLRPGEKIDISSLTIQPDTLSTSVYRTVFANGESRGVTYEYVQTAIFEGLDLSQKFIKKGDVTSKKMSDMIINNLLESKNGQESLKKTYISDRMFVSKMEILIATMGVKIAEIKNSALNK